MQADRVHIEKRICLIVDDLGGYIVCVDGKSPDPSDPEGDAKPCYRTRFDAQIAAHNHGYTHFRTTDQGKARPISRECQESSERPIPIRLNRVGTGLY